MSAQHTDIYRGSVRSALARCRRELVKAGFTLGKVHGRYEPFGTRREVTEGPNVSRVGCSDSIALIWVKRGETRSDLMLSNEMMHHARVALRKAGLPFDTRGWLNCTEACTAAVRKARGETPT